MNHKLLIIGMMLVTMIPRILPFFAFKTENMPPLLKSFLSFIPYTVLGALILPGGLSGIEGSVGISIICLLLASLVAWFKEGIIGPVIAAVFTGVILINTGLI